MAVLLLLIPISCVERELFIRSTPPGALVNIDGQDRGRTPLIMPFEYYGTRRIEIRLRDHQVEQALIEVYPPWFQVTPMDLFFDLLWPCTLEDNHTFSFDLERFKPVDEKDKSAILQRAEPLRHEPFLK